MTVVGGNHHLGITSDLGSTNQIECDKCASTGLHFDEHRCVKALISLKADNR
jgi:hypothetical protein